MFALLPAEAVKADQGPGTETHVLTVALPGAAPELDTHRVAILKSGKTWDYYAEARWSDFLPVIVQDNFIKLLEKSGTFADVASDQTGTPSGLVLKAVLRGFQAEYDSVSAAPLIKIRISVRLAYARDGETAFSFDVAAEKRAESDSLPAVQAAFQQAFGQVQKSLLRKMRERSF